MTHDFKRSLEYSHSMSDEPFWDECYRGFFGERFMCSVDYRHNGSHQAAGIDRAVMLSDSSVVYVDEKVRARDFGDIALEYISNDRRNTPGWVCKDLRCQYIAYAIYPTKTCYLLPVHQLQRAWTRYGKQWLALANACDVTAGRRGKYSIVRARNNGYTTLSVGVPVDTIFNAIGNCMKTTWK